LHETHLSTQNQTGTSCAMAPEEGDSALLWRIAGDRAPPAPHLVQLELL